MPAALGSVYWAVAPFAPEPPFRLYAGEGQAPVVVSETPKLTEARGAELTVLVSVKARPVLVITEPAGRYSEVLALRLRRLSKLTEVQREAVRIGEADDLAYLKSGQCPGLEEENAAVITTALRLPVSALDLARPLGRLDGAEIRTIHERLVRAYRLDLGGLILEQARELLAGMGGEGSLSSSEKFLD
ncbi:MAG TPA: hypothetical protein VHR65_07440 [Solirubrobacterales bacterium]|jgi:hypothetical protein|nr:hypothetical protein [Solirubrobacterales bacterium]